MYRSTLCAAAIPTAVRSTLTVSPRETKLPTICGRSELDYLIYNDPLAYADLILNGDPEEYLRSVTEYKPLD